MRIGIDMRMAGTGEGIGRYCEELVRHLAEIDHENEYFLISSSQFPIFNEFSRPNFHLVRVKSRYYSFMEQTYFIWELFNLRLDLMHFSSFNVPIFYPRRFIVTIHDVIHHRFPGRKKTRLLHRLAYRATIWLAAKRASKVIAVSETTAEDIRSVFGINKEKIAVIYEGAMAKTAEAGQNHHYEKPFLLFVGVWRQYKNLPKLALAFDILREKYKIDANLVLAGKIDPFYPEIKKTVFSIKNSMHIKAPGFVSDQELANLYQKATIFVLPSLVEGFGLIGIEAQTAGKPVAASDIPVLREILGQGAVYFNPDDEQDMAEKIADLWLDENKAQMLANKGLENAKRFDWKNTALQTRALYEGAIA
ncbi:MAG: hypothetical protein A3C85_00555 [Candidatus Doudnabacteria bacterium RIFCSPHIGHO2_02_FULL_48_21]|nr:MAG: hypothetical protein A3K05_04895 [Candidatus Doudnabacteria bacterium RIFCSPHIGHO2_01_48_18]OGE77138.1 MAG: hypothetical protein A2668_03935 [Candidatus Doudnabacteria bacterium RIFCSPHIGHO2_01_FULL_48_180]OGE91587.1 MAG: hypothetical protein A3F44_04435 [Candidatus Doudnabacteria bacterium RIFCSPHIGHO2_12_FULL_47_25]OGE93850.1 MAG: hypothetical protein A3C85_00555 [Candidatus Doudnabacteria bacterium RIFCSPHIGHO2_02_FULL_48_21]